MVSFVGVRLLIGGEVNQSGRLSHEYREANGRGSANNCRPYGRPQGHSLQTATDEKKAVLWLLQPRTSPGKGIEPRTGPKGEGRRWRKAGQR